MDKHNKPVILVGCSRNFLNQSFVAQKLERALSEIAEYSVIASGGGAGLIREVLGTRVIAELPSNLKISEIRKSVAQSEYVVMFWDGTELEEFVYSSMLHKKKLKVFAVETTKIVNKDKGERYDIYIGRGTPWGNPFAIGIEGTREEVIAKYKVYFRDNILQDEQRRKDLLSLKGKRLACHCKPMACHGDVIAEYLNSLPSEE